MASLTLLLLPSCFAPRVPDVGIDYKPTWSARVDLKSPKTFQEYDAIIVGSGFGGLTCGALLAKEGLKVLMLEQRSEVGGFGSDVQEKDMKVLYGALDISGVQRGSVGYLLKELSLNKEYLLKKINTRRFILDGKTIDVNDAEGAFEKALVKHFPQEKDAIEAFFTDAKKAYFEVFDELSQKYGIPLSREVLVKVLDQEEFRKYPETHVHMMPWMKLSYQEQLDQYFKDETLKSVLKSFLGYVGADARKTSAFMVLVTNIGPYMILNGYFPLGGPQRFADVLKEYITARGGVVLCSHRANKVLVANGNVTGVVAEGKSFASPIVVANVNAKTLFLDLIDQRDLPAQFYQDIQDLKKGRSTLVINLLVDMDLSSYPTNVADKAKRRHFFIPTNLDPSIAQRGKSALIIMQSAQKTDFPAPESPEYAQYMQGIVSEIIKQTEDFIPNISEKIVSQYVLSPHWFETEFSMPDGAIYAYDQASAKIRPYFKSPIAGLYLSSASSAGSGIEAVVIEGIKCKHDILGWKKK